MKINSFKILRKISKKLRKRNTKTKSRLKILKSKKKSLMMISSKCNQDLNKCKR